MAKRYWTADQHYGHPAIIEYCHRPFKDAEHMNERLIAEHNMRVKPEDCTINVGDFCTRGFAKGVEGLRLKGSYYLERLNGNQVIVTGNHDRQNHTKTTCEHMFVKIGPQYAFVSHYPTDSDWHDPELMDYVYGHCNFAICGHVHEIWAYKMVSTKCGGLLNFNVGVDQHNYRPISDDELLVLVNTIKRKQ